MKSYELYRFTHPDGTAKEWAWCDLGNGQAEIRWGPADQLRQSQVKPVHVARERAAEKLRKGYAFVGSLLLNEQGSRVPDNAPMGRAGRVRPQATVSAVDLAALLGGGDGFYF
jgi:hypothetical protein